MSHQERIENIRRDFENYFAAVGADRFRVTCITLAKDGKTKAFILDKKDGKTKGFSPQEILEHIPEMVRLEARGENIYYTPLSESRHHILIDDMNREKLENLISSGYRPAVLIESSPKNFQAVITIPKLNTTHDKHVANRLTERLNKQFGDPNFFGCIHPHRAPGFTNQKLSHRREDGTFPQVQLAKFERRECQKTFDMSKEIDLEYERQAQLSVSRPGPTIAERAGGAGGGVSSSAYYAHYHHITERLGGVSDFSRMDSMIAVRLRVTGHSQAAVQAIIQECAPTIRTSDRQESHNWKDYSERTAAYAFSYEGDKEVEKNGKYKEQWLSVEKESQEKQDTTPPPPQAAQSNDKNFSSTVEADEEDEDDDTGPED